MNIRCERCSTTYELDEKLLAPEGSPVQCTKCQHVFTAVPPRAAGRTLVGVPAPPPPQPVAPPRAASAPRSTGAAGAEPHGSGSRQGPAIYRRSPPSGAAASSASPAAHGPRARRDTMGTFEARLRANARLRWLIPLVGAVAVLAIVAVVMVVRGGVDPAARRRHAEAMALVSLDDLASLERANKTLEELARQRTGIDSLEADRALAQLLLATGLLEGSEPQAERFARKVAERDRATAAQSPPETLKALSAEVEALRGQVEPRRSKARSLADQAYAALKKMAAEQDGDLEVARALAIHSASVGDREQALRFIRASGGPGERDPWIRLAEAWLDAREEGKEPRERGVVKLTALVAAHPQIVRARFLLAEAQAALGRREQAAATLDGLLAANPAHNRARSLREELVVPASPPAPALPATLVRPAPIPPPMPVGATAPAGLPPVQAAATPVAPRPPPAVAPGVVGAPAGPVPAPRPPPVAPPVPRAAPTVPAPVNGAVAPRPAVQTGAQPVAAIPPKAPAPAPAPAAAAAAPAPAPAPAAPAGTAP